MSLFTASRTKDGGRFFKAVGAGSGAVRFDGASDARGLLHAIADATVRHRAAVLGYEGSEHPTLDAREVGSSISSRPDLTTAEQIVLAQIRIYQDKTGRSPTADEIAAFRRDAESSLQDLLGDRNQAATPLQKGVASR